MAIANTKDLTLRQMFDISTRLVSEQDEISGLETIAWEIRRTPNLTMHGKTDWDGSNHLRNTETLAESTASQWFECEFVPRFNMLQLSEEVSRLLLRGEESYLCRCSRTFPWKKTMNKNVWRMPNSFLCVRNLEKDNGHLFVPLPKSSGTVSVKTVHRSMGQYG